MSNIGFFALTGYKPFALTGPHGGYPLHGALIALSAAGLVLSLLRSTPLTQEH